MERDVLHLAVPAFPIALARLSEPVLRGRPVAVAPGHSARALIQCVSSEARADGVEEGMSVRRARQFCPALSLLPPDPAVLSRGTGELLALFSRYTPVTEPARPGHFFLDLTGSRRLLGPGRDAAMRLEREIAGQLGLHANVGVAGNKLVSRIAAGCLDKPGICDVLRGSEAGFIAPLPVGVLPGVGRARQALLLQELNLRRIEEVAALGIVPLRLAFGAFAPLLHQRARGIDPSPVQPPRRSPQVSEESVLPRAENDDAWLLAELCRLVEECGRRLRRQGRGARRLILTVTYADGMSRQAVASPETPLCGDLELFPVAEELFERAGRRRLRVRSMRFDCGRLAAPDRQLDLFAGAVGPDRLQESLDRLRDRYGMAAVRWGRSFGA